MVVKHDMLKDYGTVSRKYLIKVFWRFGFPERITNIIVRLIINNWSSILLNGRSFGLFHSTRGL